MSQCVRKRMASSAFSVDEEGQKKKKTEKNLGPVEPRGGIGHTVLKWSLGDGFGKSAVILVSTLRVDTVDFWQARTP